MSQEQTPEISDCLLPIPFAGVFSEHSNKVVGFGATKKKETVVSYWYVVRDEDGETYIQPLNTSYAPTGKKRRISCDDVVKRFNPEPALYSSKVLPALKEMENAVSRGDRHRKKGELYSAEFEYEGVIKVDENHIRANFGLGLTYLERGEGKKAADTFKKIVSLEEAFDTDHKHLFNEFGIRLRENHMYDEALEYYTKALDLCGWDDHLLFNISRAHYEKDNLNKSYAFLIKALEANPELEEAKKFKSHLLNKNPALAAMEATVESPCCPPSQEDAPAEQAGKMSFNF